MTTNEKTSQEVLNEKMQNREIEEYYEDKLLFLRMVSFLDNYKKDHELSTYKNKLDDLKKQQNELLQQKSKILSEINSIKEAKQNYDKTLADYNEKITKEEKNKSALEKELISEKQYAESMKDEQNLLNYIIKNFPADFKKEILNICTKKVAENLDNKPEQGNTNEKNNSNKNKDNQNFPMQNQRMFPYYSNMAMNMQTTQGGMRPVMMNYPYTPFMMYYPGVNMQNMPNMQNMQQFPPNQFYMVPMPANMQPQPNDNSNNK